MEDLGRFNVLLELCSELAQADDLDTMLSEVGGRLRWVLEFERLTFALLRTAEPTSYLTMTSGRACLEPAAWDTLPPVHQRMISTVLRDGTPMSGDPPIDALCHPLAVNGRCFGAICLSDDRSTYRYRDLRVVHHVANSLAGTVARLELATSLRRQSLELAAANRSKDEFLAMLGHELRNPLAPIVTAAELLAVRAGTAIPLEITVIRRHAEHLNRLIDDLLDVSRLARGDLELRLAPVEIATVVARSMEMVGVLLDQRQHTVELDVASTELSVHGDLDRLAQVVANLLTNAARYTDVGGRVRVTTRRDGDDVVIEVADNGSGMAPELLPSVFTRFVRGSRSLDLARSGLGLGLAIVKALTELHGGSVSARSEGPGLGSTFSVRLPVLESRGALESSELSAPAGFLPEVETTTAGSQRRILLVDDNEDAAFLLGSLLEAFGHTVTVCHDAERALAEVAALSPQIALLDIGLPDMDGCDLARALRSQLGAATPYLIAITGYGQPRDRQRTGDAGFDAHLVKPVELKDLVCALEGAPSVG